MVWYPKLKIEKLMSKLGDILCVEQTSVTQRYHRRGMGAKPPEAGDFFGKLRYFDAIGSHSECVKPLSRSKFLTLESQLKKIKLFNPLFTYYLSQKHVLKSCILGLNFVSDLAQVGGSKVHCLVQYFSSK